MKQLLLSIVIPSYNTEKYMDECLPTFLDRDLENKVEIIIVNDGSKDNTLEIANRYSKEYSSLIRVINKENGGHGSAINKGIESARGKYFKVVDGDDWVDTTELKAFVEYLEELDVDMILNPFTIVNDKTKDKQMVSYDNLEYEKEYDADVLYRICNNIQMHSITYKTNILQNNNIKIDENMFYVDQEYNLFPIPFVRKVLYLPMNIYQYRIFTASQSMNFLNLQKNREMHKKVVISLEKYYLMHEISDIKKIYFIDAVSRMAFLQILIYFTMKMDSNTKKEIRLFLEIIDTFPFELNWNKAFRVVRLYKKLGYKFETLFSLWVRIRMKKQLQG